MAPIPPAATPATLPFVPCHHLPAGRGQAGDSGGQRRHLGGRCADFDATAVFAAAAVAAATTTTFRRAGKPGRHMLRERRGSSVGGVL